MTTVLPRKPWTILFYLCGDTDQLADEIEENLRQIQAAGSSPHCHVVVQRDGRHGAMRMVVPEADNDPAIVREFGSVNTGDPGALLEFLLWGIETCPSDRIAVLIGGLGIFQPGFASDDELAMKQHLFSICDDQSSQDALDVVDLEATFNALRERIHRDPPIDLLGFDMCQIQFLEVAYQLEGLARVLVAAQGEAPQEGWRYDHVLRTWEKQLVDGSVGPAALATTLVAEGYAKVDVSTSAVDLTRLADVTRAFDAFMTGMMQTLGEDLIWNARSQVLGVGEQVRIHIEGNNANNVVYDLGKLMRAIKAFMEDAERYPLTNWLDLKIAQAYKWNRVRLDRLAELVRRAAREIGAASAVIERTIALIVTPDETGLLRPLSPTSSEDRDRLEAVLERAIDLAEHALPAEMIEDLKTIPGQAAQAQQLALLATKMIDVLVPSTAEHDRFVIACRAADPELSGISIYRPGYAPGQLDDLNEINYLQLKFHRHIHWAAYLGAVSLIETHPRALWKLVSSLLSSASPSAREDVLERIVGRDSVMAGFREQLQALASPPGLILSLDPEERLRPGMPAQLFYRLRLDTNATKATLVEQRSRVNQDTLKHLLARLDELLASQRTSGEDLTALEALGRTLFEDILQALSIRLDNEWLRANERANERLVHLQIQLPRELMRYPWELMHDGTRWLGERYALGRQVFMESAAARSSTARRPGPIRALVIGDPILDFDPKPGQLDSARSEAELLRDHFEELAQSLDGLFEFDPECDARIGTRLTGTDLRGLLRTGGYDIVHFAGHARFDPQDPECSAWLLSDGPLWALNIRNTLAQCRNPPWLVFANACQAAMDSDEKPPAYQQEVFGLATAFINQGVSAYVGPQWPVADGVAIELARNFYQSLLCDRSTLGEAVCRAKLAVKDLLWEANSRGGIVPLWPAVGIGWASLVLYGDPTATLTRATCGTPVKERRSTSPRKWAPYGTAATPSNQSQNGPVVSSATVAIPAAANGSVPDDGSHPEQQRPH